VADAPEATPESVGLAAARRQELRTALAGLDPLARQVVTCRYGLTDGVPRTLDTVATILRLPEGDVWALEATALARLRDLLTGPAPAIPAD
jgi:DNA-directed RNA polymerase sigma subunit (sigma70/sigma32)